MAWEWLILDPTPPTADPELLAQGTVAAAAARWVGLLPFMELLDRYFKASLIDTLYGLPPLAWILLAMLLVLFAALFVWADWCSRKLRAYRVWPQWLRVVKKLGIVAEKGATPRELAKLAADKLPKGEQALRQALISAAEFGYCLRFGGVDPTTPESFQQADHLLDMARMARMLKQ